MDNTLLKYVRDFSAQVAQYRSHKTEESLALLSHTASLLSTSLQQQELNVQHLHVVKFLVDLHAIMSTLATDSYALWSCVAMLQQCSRDEQTRQVLVEHYRFVPMLIYILERTQAPDKMEKLFQVLQELTYDIKIEFEEPYVELLLHKLTSIIESTAEGVSEDTHAQLALSILINLCKKNVLVLYMLLRKINLSQFSRKINQFGMQGTQLFVILSREINAPDVKELQLFLRSFFASIVETLKKWNLPELRNNIEFLLDSSPQSNLYASVLNYTTFDEEMNTIITEIKNFKVTWENATEKQQMCMEPIFRLFRFIYEIKTEDKIKDEIFINNVYTFLCPWIQSNICGKDAIHLLETLIRHDNHNIIYKNMSSDKTVVDLIILSEDEKTPTVMVTKILQVLNLLLDKSSLRNIILSRITESYFDRMFAPLMESKASLGTLNFSLNEVEKATFALSLLVSFADIATRVYQDKCWQLFKMKEIQNALSMTMLNGSQEACCAVFQMSSLKQFPQELVAQQIAASKRFYLDIHSPTMEHFNTILKTQHAHVGKQLEERMQALIETIENAQKENKLNDLATSRIVELFSYERDNYKISEQNMRLRLEQTSQEITHLTQRLNMQNAQLQEYRTLNFQKTLKEESLTSLTTDLKQQKVELKKNMTELMKKLTQKTEQLVATEKRSEILRAQFSEINQKLETALKSLKEKTEQHEKLLNIVKENTQRIETLKKTIVVIDTEKKAKEQVVEDLEKSLARTKESLEEQINAKQNSDGVIATLEKELREKKKQLENCEQELRETEEMRQTIMSLMENKKRKR